MNQTSKSQSFPQSSASKSHSAQLAPQTREVGHDIAELGRHAAGAVKEGVHYVADATGQLIEVSKERVIAGKDVVADSIRENPLRSVLIAAGTGALLSWLFGRK